MTHRRAVDRVRSEQATDRQARTHHPVVPHDEVSEVVEDRVQAERVRRCLETLTDRQRGSVTLAYYHGYTCQEITEQLQVPLGTVKTRIRDGLIRLRDCLGADQ